ncbi:MAG: T9SS type A sorting domain-containing protein, partial [Flavobacteriales bacterium]|nr:T9SS type A sorting domain-containing protein [Flavobacteriales bacterium]
LFNYFFCDTIQDGSYISVNGNQLGLLGGSDANSILFSCTGTYANFAHYNDSLFGLDDDTPDSLMGATDVLADIKSYVNDNDTVINLTYTYQSSWRPLTNPIAAVMLSYATPCDTFSTAITTATDTICAGDSVQLQATGGVNYSWFGAFGGLSNTSIANPMAIPPQTTTYIATITNDSGCVKTEQVKIWVETCIGIADASTSLSITSIYPNPTTGNITIEFNELIQQAMVTILNNLGQVVYHKNYAATSSINLSLNAPQGIYFVQIQTDEGIITKKIVKH